MRRISSQIVIAFVITPLFLLTSISDGLGYVWCVGNDGHSVVGLCAPVDNAEISAERSDLKLLKIDGNLLALDSDCGPCLDTVLTFPLTSPKKPYKNTQNDNAKINVTCNISYQNQNTHSTKLVPQTLTRISREILAHRTVVLLI